MDFKDRIKELSNQITDYYKALNYHSAWLLLAVFSVRSLGDSHPVAAMVGIFLVMYFYIVMVMNGLKITYGDRLIVDGWKVHIKKAIGMLRTEIQNNCTESERQELLDLLEEKCSSQIRFKSFFRHRPFLITYGYFCWMFYEIFILFLHSMK
ncbi:MAG: hypothetical protein Q4C79_08410 [Neisseria sp.]|uniref:hypothetical protein n=1 Tax=Neisseria sp. TaxID=192066 RepID=UPI0026DAA5EB|nr:hypothetical protein [Neisseria sp.]MDO4248959.1 hypothetical protein [Neisseria sp.]